MRIESPVANSAASIGAVRPQGLAQGLGPPGVVPPKGAGTAQASDDFSVSSAAQQVAAWREKMIDDKDDRALKIESIKNQIESNTYRPDNGAVADAVIREHMPPRYA